MALCFDDCVGTCELVHIPAYTGDLLGYKESVPAIRATRNEVSRAVAKPCVNPEGARQQEAGSPGSNKGKGFAWQPASEQLINSVFGLLWVMP